MSDGNSRNEVAAPPTARRRGPYRKSATTRQAILDAAMDVFAARGYAGGSLREIAGRIGIDQSSILHHFPTKQALLRAVMEERDRRDDDVLAEARPATIADVPEAFLALARRNASTPGVLQLYSLLAAESVTPQHPLGDYFRERLPRVRAGFAQWFAELDAAGMLRAGLTPDFAASAFFALWEGAQLHSVIDPAGIDVVDVLERFLDLVTEHAPEKGLHR
ncbi:TetR/AcrR family transcriptional regulator [Microbacterium hominis]|uniref:TetR/AcrR family transcriptional regulator n=1 Tax=Microbacterium hominis TaxID=162426 RepID=A0A7D4U6H7_9MICO|nr:TetR/AcrR family transcriptional regulator [Microbacterium hominis]QKJ18366.1 TetR/AcrR family transcriptional regulator [Microbacterium hominis]